jgi:hypothetical protein
MNHAYWFDAGQILADIVTLGLVPRPWYRSKVKPGYDVFAYFGIEDFDPAVWKPIQPNRAFTRMTLRDAQWMARILARFSDDDLRELAKVGRFSRPEVAEELARILIGRKDRILARYLVGQVPLGRPWLASAPTGAANGDGKGRWLCVEDLAVTGGVVAAAEVRYRRRLLAPPRHRGDRLAVLEETWYGLAGDRPVGCVPAPPGGGLLELSVTQGGRPAGAMAVVLREESGEPRVVAVQRREKPLPVHQPDRRR